jgi:Domain of unknown function (DUF1931)
MIAALDPSERLPTHVTTVTKFTRFFRAVAGLDVDKQDLKRYGEFINHKVHDLLLCGEKSARMNGRDIIRPFDLPITKGLRQCMCAFDEVDQKVELAPVLDHLTARPLLTLDYSEEMEHELARVAGGLSVAVARTFKVTAPNKKNPRTEDWKCAIEIFDLLL